MISVSDVFRRSGTLKTGMSTNKRNPGPAAFLPSEILGLRPLEDGWKRFKVEPNLGLLKWVSATVPTAFGNIIVDLDGNNMTLNIPAGTIAEWNGKSISGPRVVNELIKIK